MKNVAQFLRECDAIYLGDADDLNTETLTILDRNLRFAADHVRRVINQRGEAKARQSRDQLTGGAK